MAQKLKVLSQFGTIDTNNKNIALGSGDITTTGSVSAGAVTTTGAVSISNGSFAVGTSTQSVPLTLNGPTIIPSANYNYITSTSPTSPIPAGVYGTIIDAVVGSAFVIDFPTSPTDGQVYTISFGKTQTSAVTTSPAAEPAIATNPTAGTANRYVYIGGGTAKWVISG